MKRIRKAEVAEFDKFKKFNHPTNSAQVETSSDTKRLECFVKKLNGESKNVFADENWVNIMGTTVYVNGKFIYGKGTGDFDKLKLDVDGKDRMKIDKDEAKKACVVQLLKLIRNKIELE